MKKQCPLNEEFSPSRCTLLLYIGFLSPRLHGLVDWLKSNTSTIKFSLFIFHLEKRNSTFPLTTTTFF